MVVIKTHFDIGNKVWIVNAETKYKQKECRECGKSEDKPYTVYTISKVYIDAVHIDRSREPFDSKVIYTHENYEVSGTQDGCGLIYTDIYDVANLYKTKKEAQAECDRKNKLYKENK